jgi:hypothetical protein
MFHKSKKHLHSVFFILFLVHFSFCQAVQKGTFINDPYIGGPNFGKQVIAVSTLGKVDASGIGPLGLRMEFLISDRVGVTFDGIFNSAAAKYRYTPDIIVNDDGMTVPNNKEYSYSIQLNSLRIQFGMNYHFDFFGDNSDFFLGFGGGTDNVQVNFSSTEPNFVGSLKPPILILPFSLRLRVGTRYYFSEFLGANLEIGLGGPFISGGLSFRLK